MIDHEDKDRRVGERRSSRDRRSAKRRSGIERRKADFGPAMSPTGRDRRTGWDRRISDRRTSRDRRRGERRARVPTRPPLSAVALRELRQLASRLYIQAKRSRRPSKPVLTQLGEIRAELLHREPDLDTVAHALERLAGSAAAKLPEYELAVALLPAASPPEDEVGTAATAFADRDTVLRLKTTLAAPLDIAVPQQAERGGGKPNTAERATGKRAAKTKTTKTKKTKTKKRGTKKVPKRKAAKRTR